ncbi:MAG: inositol monophosphatase family protein [Halieaceae bacterium]
MEPMTNIALRAARKAGDIIARATEDIDHIDVESKGANDYVSEVDRAAEREIIYHLSKAYPDHAFLGEEGGASGNEDSEYRWIIDPLDGTTNFLRGIPHFAVSIACEYRGKMEHAVVVDPIRREEFVASRGRGARLNDRRIRVSKRKSLDGALLGTGIPFRARHSEHMAAYASSLETLAASCAGIRRAGAAALDLAYVAAGRLDAFWEIGLAPWDIAAGSLLVREAGGLIADFNGEEGYLESGNIVCGNPKCFKAVLQVTRPALGHINQA